MLTLMLVSKENDLRWHVWRMIEFSGNTFVDGKTTQASGLAASKVLTDQATGPDLTRNCRVATIEHDQPLKTRG